MYFTNTDKYFPYLYALGDCYSIIISKLPLFFPPKGRFRFNYMLIIKQWLRSIELNELHFGLLFLWWVGAWLISLGKSIYPWQKIEAKKKIAVCCG